MNSKINFKENPEIESNEYFPIEGSDIKLSMVICCWSTAHLLRRSVYTYERQDFPNTDWELILVLDASPDKEKAYEAVEQLKGKINLRVISLAHNLGMRGNTVAFNTGWAWAQGEILAESTPEIMLPDDCITRLYKPHLTHDFAFVAMKTFNLQPEVTIKIDEVNWKEDIGNIMQIDGFFCDWTLNNLRNTHFGTHQLSSFKKSTFYKCFPDGFILYGGYGEEDPKFLNMREKNKVEDITIMQPLAIHQWHAPYGFWQMKGYSKFHNRHGHSNSNFLNDLSGEVPPSGTRSIFDGGKDEWFTQREIDEWAYLDDLVRASGCEVSFDGLPDGRKS